MSSTPLIDQYDDSAEVPLPQLAPVVLAKKQTYGQILKSSAMVGGSTVLNVGIGIVRTKAMAILLGPGGFGLAGLYMSIITLTQTIAGMGINSSGVRQIAEAAGSGDKERIARTAAVLRRTSIVLGLIGAAVLVLFSRQVSKATFGTNHRAGAVCLISLAVLFQLVSGGQGALIQGMRRIADLAKMNVIGALSGTLISIPVVYLFREKGIAFSLVCGAGTAIITSWWYSRKIRIMATKMTASQIGEEAAGLLKLGIVFMVTGLMVPAVAYVVRIILLHKVGIAATGLYQSAWTLGGLYTGFILQAMGADFYPRLSAVANDNVECNRLVNEQALIGLLLAGPGVITTLTFAPLVIEFFYSAKFGGAVEVLRWISLGMMLQVITWPMGFIIVAKAERAIFFGCELAWATVSLILVWTCITKFGLNGAGIAFFGSYIFHGILVYAIVRRQSCFRWSLENKQLGAFFGCLIAVAFCSYYVLAFRWSLFFNALLLVVGVVYSARTLTRLIPWNQIPYSIRRLLRACGLSPSSAPVTS